jgi:predicted acylesterase/phospholipase RssA
MTASCWYSIAGARWLPSSTSRLVAVSDGSSTGAVSDGFSASKLFRVLALDGGGAKGFYTLGALKEIEGLVGCPLYRKFDLIYGTSAGARC